LFSASGTSGLSIICSKGYLPLLEYYLPLYIEYINATPSDIEFYDTFSLVEVKKNLSGGTAIQ
jgi:hypothetical protein